MRIVAVDLFAGMGGFTEGAIQGGAEVILSVDSESDMVNVHKKNHPAVRVEQTLLGNPDWHIGLIRMLEPYRGSSIYPDYFHIHIHGSPPCQALSNASSTDAEEGMVLVNWFLDTVKKLKEAGLCDSWSMENVVPVRKRLPDWVPSVILNSADFGVAQTRSRCWAGEGWFAEPTHSREEWVGVIDALPYLADELYEGRLVVPIQRKVGVLKANGRILQPLWREIDDPINTITGARCHIGTQKEDIPRKELGTAWAKPQTPSRKVVVNTAGCGASTSKAGTTRDSPIEDPSKTIHNNMPTLRDLTFDKPTKIRALTMEETLVLQGFDPCFDMSPAKTMKSRWTMVGNAVPPPVARAVIRGIGKCQN